MNVAFLLKQYFDNREGETKVLENGFWQGTIIYMEISTSKEIDPNEVVDHKNYGVNSVTNRFLRFYLLDKYGSGFTI